ncbi:MAG: glycosyltransferase family 4 protein [Pseudomonadota bacterium]
MTAGPRLALLTPAWPGHATPNGIATAVRNLAIGLKQTGQSPVIIAARIDGIGPEDIPVVEVPVLRMTVQDRIKRRFGRQDVLQPHFARQIACAVSTAATRYGIKALLMEETQGWAHLVELQAGLPVIMVLHGPTALLNDHSQSHRSVEDIAREAREALAFATATALIAPSRHVLEGVEALVDLNNIPRIVLPNSFEPDDMLCAPRTLLLPDILFVGRFDAIKGGDVVLQAFDRLCKTHPGSRLTFLGPDRGVVRSDGSTLGFDAAFAALSPEAKAGLSYHGPADRSEVLAHRRTHGIALIGSRYETFGYVLIEAMAAGQAIVCTSVGGLAEILKDREAALLIPPGHPDAMAQALARLLDDVDLRQRLATAAAGAVRADFDPAKVAAETVEFVAQVLRDRAAAHPSKTK